MNNDLNPNTASVALNESKPVTAISAPVAAPAVPLVQQPPAGSKKGRYGKKSGGAPGGSPRVTL